MTAVNPRGPRGKKQVVTALHTLVHEGVPEAEALEAFPEAGVEGACAVAALLCAFWGVQRAVCAHC